MTIRKWAFAALCAGWAALAGPGPTAASERVSFTSEALWPNVKALSVTGNLSRPKGDGPFPAVVLLPNCGGPKSQEFASFWPRYLNGLGYLTLNVDVFTPRRQQKCSKKFKPGFEDMTQDAYGALAYLSGRQDVDVRRVGVLGSSLGAHTVNELVGLGKRTAAGHNFAAAVSLYPVSCNKVSPGAGMIPLLVVQGDKERGAASCRRLGANPSLSVTILPDTYHGFDQPSATPRKNGTLKQDPFGNKRLYSKSATQKAQALVKEFLAARLSAAAAAAGAATVPAAVEPAPEVLPKVGGKDPYVAVKRRDANGDGKVGRDEWDKSPGVFAKIDADGDGFITPREFYDRWKAMQ